MSSPTDQDIKALLELGDELRRLVARRDVIQALIEPKSDRNWRTADVVGSTIMIAGSLIFAAAVSPWSFVAAPYGVWRLVRAIGKDSAQENRQAALRRELKEVERDRTEAEIKIAAIKERLFGGPP